MKRTRPDNSHNPPLQYIDRQSELWADLEKEYGSSPLANVPSGIPATVTSVKEDDATKITESQLSHPLIEAKHSTASAQSDVLARVELWLNDQEPHAEVDHFLVRLADMCSLAH